MVAAILLACPASAWAKDARIIDHSFQYRACMTLVQKDPSAAYESGGGWLQQGGANAARHCMALALLKLGRNADGAKLLEELAQAMARTDDAPLIPDVLGQAGQAWLESGDTSRAYAVQTTALKLRPNDPDLLIDRAVTLAEAKNYNEAVDDLTKALEKSPRNLDALVLRASAYRFVDKLDLASADIEAALAAKADAPEALLERGIIRRLRQDPAGARADWLKVLALAPQSRSGDLARANIEKLDIKQ